VADLGFWKGGHFFSKGGAVVSKKYFLGSIRSSISSFFVRFCWEKSKNFSRRGRSPPAPPPLNPPLICMDQDILENYYYAKQVSAKILNFIYVFLILFCLAYSSSFFFTCSAFQLSILHCCCSVDIN